MVLDRPVKPGDCHEHGAGHSPKLEIGDDRHVV